MKIAIINPRISYYVGGGEMVSLRHAEYLSKIEGNTVNVFTIKPVHKDYSQMYKIKKSNNNLQFTELEIPKKYKYIYNTEPGQDQNRWDSESILFNNMVHDEINNEKYDIVLSYYVHDAMFNDLKIPNVVYFGGFPRKRIPMYTAFLNFCDATISNSKNVRKLWNNDISDAMVKHNFIIPKGADTICKNEAEKNNNNKKIVFAGRLIERKGIRELVKVFKNVNEKINDTQLFIIGHGPLKRELKDMVKEFQLKDSVIFTGTINNVQDYFINSDLCIFPSLEGEGLMTVVAEAMMAGVCIITTKGMGNEEIIKHLHTGILVEPGNNKELEKNILKYLDNKSLRKEIGNNAKEFAVKNFSWKIVANKLDKILKEVINSFDKDVR